MNRSPISARILWPLLALAITIFGAVLATITWQLRDDLRQQMLQREASALKAITDMLAHEVAEDYTALGLEVTPNDVLPEVAVMAAAVRGVEAVSLHNAQGQFTWGVPEEQLPLPLPPLGTTTPPTPAVRYHADFPEAVLFNTASDTRAPFVEVLLPHDQDARTAAMRFWLDGSTVAHQFATLDQRLWRQAGGAWALGSGLIVSLALSLQHLLSRRQRQLEQRTRELEQANRDLDLQAKSTAIGAIASSLIHDLRGPLSVLQMALESPNASRQHAIAAALKMQQLISEIVTIMRDQQHVRALPYAWEDIAFTLREAFADERLHFAGELPSELSGQQGGLTLLVLKQLISNALRASAKDAPVTVMASSCRQNVIQITVTDEAGGLPETLREALFRPLQEGQGTGSGLGLTIARQIAASMGGELRLLRSDDRGSCFALNLTLTQEPPEDPSAPAHESSKDPAHPALQPARQ